MNKGWEVETVYGFPSFIKFKQKIMHRFNSVLDIIVGNPFVYVPDEILKHLFEKADKTKGPIPVKGEINGKPYQQTLVKYSGAYRLYINMIMLKNSPRRIGEAIEVSIAYDPADRTVEPHPKWLKALQNNAQANKVFEGLSPSRQKEMIRYISNLKTEESVDRNVKRAINFLLGKERFVGRDKP